MRLRWRVQRDGKHFRRGSRGPAFYPEYRETRFDHSLDPNLRDLREVLLELVKALDMEQGGELAERLQSIYEFCINECATGDLDMIRELLEELREGWREGVLDRQPA